MKYKTVQTMMLPDSTEENHGLYYQGTEGVHAMKKKNHYTYRRTKKQNCLHILMVFIRDSGQSIPN